MAATKAIRQREVTVYCTNWCPHSRRAKALLERYNVTYGNVDIEQDPASARQVEAWNRGLRSVPTMLFHLIVTEPSTTDLETILLRSGAARVSLTTYITNWCPHSRRIEAWLRQNHIDSVVVDIERDREGAAKVSAWNKGFLSTPTLDISLRLTEPTSEQIEAVLGLGAG